MSDRFIGLCKVPKHLARAYSSATLSQNADADAPILNGMSCLWARHILYSVLYIEKSRTYSVASSRDRLDFYVLIQIIFGTVHRTARVEQIIR